MAGPKNYMNSEDLIASIKRRSMTPQNQSTFTDEDFLAFADEETALGLVPSIMENQEDYFLYTEVIAITNDQIRFPIPYRAVGNKLKEVAYQDPSGNVYEMTRIGVGDLPYYNASSGMNRPYSYYIENNEVVLTPQTSPSGSNASLRLSYFMRPNSLVTSDKVGAITSIDRSTGVIQLSAMPTDFTLTQLFDLIKLKSPNKTLKFDITPVSINNTSKTITLNVADIPDALAIGDQIALATQCSVPQIPSDFHVILAHRVAMRCLEAMGDLENLQAGNAKLAEFEQKLKVLSDNRVDDSPRKIVPRHASIRSGLTRGRRAGRF